MRVAEADIVDRVAAFISSGGGEVFREVASLGQSADLVWTMDDELTFVEVKVNAIKRAIEQCRAHELVADYVCVAVGTKNVRADNLDSLRERGYGLISCVGEDCRWVLRPKRMDRNWPPARQRVMARMKGDF